eukprot:scaffold2529_cov122-Isochrysis_galbana.AAC.3
MGHEEPVKSAKMGVRAFALALPRFRGRKIKCIYMCIRMCCMLCCCASLRGYYIGSPLVRHV